MGLIKSQTKTLAAASANNIATAQSLGAAGNLTLNGSTVSGGVAILDTSRQVLITSVGNDSGITFTVTGTNDGGNPISETVTGSNASNVGTNSDFKTVTQVSASGATAGNVTVGTSAIGDTPWETVNWHVTPINIGFGVVVTGTVTYTIQHTMDDPNNLPSGVSTPFAFSNPTFTAQTTSQTGSYIYPVAAIRARITAGTGSIRFVTMQADISGA